MIIKELVINHMRLCIITLLMIITSCTNDKRDDSPVEKIPNERVGVNEVNVEGCYVKIVKRDTMVLHLEQNGKNVSGKMSFDNYEKDGSTGEVKGVIEKDIVKIWYNFQSEGMNSVRQLHFKINDSSLVLGVGPMTDRADSSFFTDDSTIDFSKDQSFIKTDCSSLPVKYL